MRAAHLAPCALTTSTLIRLGRITNRTFVLPLLILFPTGRCNSRCVSCDWWKQSGADDLTIDEMRALAQSLPALGTRVVVFSGGEPLLRPEVFDAADAFLDQDIALHLLTSGVLLERFADRVGRRFSRVCVSLDATSDALYERIRGVNALGTVARGVARLRREAPDVPVTGRATRSANRSSRTPLVSRWRAMCCSRNASAASKTSGRSSGSPPENTTTRVPSAGSDCASARISSIVRSSAPLCFHQSHDTQRLLQRPVGNRISSGSTNVRFVIRPRRTSVDVVSAPGARWGASIAYLNDD